MDVPARQHRAHVRISRTPDTQRGGLLLFGVRPQKYLLHAGISAAAYIGTAKDYGAKARETLRGVTVSLFPAPNGGRGKEEAWPGLPPTFSEAGTAVEAGVV